MHTISEPAILYFGTPVVLTGTINDDGSYNLAPMSSVFWLGWRCIIGLAASSQTTKNILRTGECVLNLASVNEVSAVNKLAKTTGSNPVPAGKKQKGYLHEANKFQRAGLTSQPADIVTAPLVKECAVQLEAVVAAVHSLAEEDEAMKGRIVTIELRIVRVHIEESILLRGHRNKIDPNKWRPLIMSFQKFYGLGNELHYSVLAEIPEELYKTADIDKAKKLQSLQEKIMLQ
jgi:flavin reductase (DIM6/NTAB) family NADH-FMN oxidoreductase RutF